ncbi:MAG: tRNA (adenosine(37)-N6)-dimethylallyltransferase MiaA [Thermodesulfobacteriota bacterium]
MPNNSLIPKIIAILGPTAVGKSKFAVELAKKINAEIISADSMQVYKYFDIGTSKPTLREQKTVNHHLIDIVNPDQEFNAGLYRKRAIPLIKQLSENKKSIILVGGTFLYIKVLLSGLIEDIPSDHDLRKSIDKLKVKKGIEHLYNKLKEIDIDSANNIHKNDYIRIQRALEVYYLTGTKMSELQLHHGFKQEEFNVFKTALNIERESLKITINERVNKMIEDGLVDEVKKVRSLGYGIDLKPMKSIGYKEINSYLDSEITLEDAVEMIKRNTRRFAKRQVTWLRSEDNINWYDIKNEKNKLLKDCMKFYGL